MKKRMSSVLADLVERGIEAHALGDDVDFEVTPHADPETGMAAGYIIALVMPGPILGTMLYVQMDVPMLAWGDEAEIDRAMKNGIEELRNQRSQVLAQPNANLNRIMEDPNSG